MSISNILNQRSNCTSTCRHSAAVTCLYYTVSITLQHTNMTCYDNNVLSGLRYTSVEVKAPSKELQDLNLHQTPAENRKVTCINYFSTKHKISNDLKCVEWDVKPDYTLKISRNTEQHKHILLLWWYLTGEFCFTRYKQWLVMAEFFPLF